MTIDSAAILQRLADFFHLKNEGSAIARFLGVSSAQVVYNWRLRNNVDLHILLTKAKEADPTINLNWLIYGEGPEHRLSDEEKPIRHPHEVEGAQTGTTVITTNEIFTLEEFFAFIQAKRRRLKNRSKGTAGGTSLSP